MPTPTDDDVVAAVVAELGSDTGYDNAAIKVLVDEVIADQTSRIPSPPGYTLATLSLFEAAVFESCSRLTYRIYVRLLTGGATQDDVTIGPLQIHTSRIQDKLAAEMEKVFERYHRLAENKMLEGGASGRQAALQVWVPATRINFI